MTPQEGRRLSAAERFLWPENFFSVTAAIGGAGLATFVLCQLFWDTTGGVIFFLIAIGLVFATIPHTLIGLFLTIRHRRHAIYCMLAGLMVAIIVFGLFITVAGLYGPNNEVWRPPHALDSEEMSVVGEMFGCGMWIFSLFGFLLGCWISYRKFRPSELPDTRRKNLDI